MSLKPFLQGILKNTHAPPPPPPPPQHNKKKKTNYEGVTADCTAFSIDRGSSLGQLNQHY